MSIGDVSFWTFCPFGDTSLSKTFLACPKKFCHKKIFPEYTYIDINFKGEIFMEIAKEKFFEVRYDTKLDRLVLKKERIVSKVSRLMRKHKLITAASFAFIMFSCLNIVMIYSFMRILQNI